EPAAEKTSFRIKNVVKTGEYFADRLWGQLNSLLTEPAARGRLILEMAVQAESIEKICARHGQTPAVLESPSRRVYCWLRFLTDESQLAPHLKALEGARETARQHPAPPKKPRSLHR